MFKRPWINKKKIALHACVCVYIYFSSQIKKNENESIQFTLEKFLIININTHPMKGCLMIRFEIAWHLSPP